MEHGGSCIDAVTAAVSSLEDNPNFDAGKGSVLNENRDIEMHAMIMRGDTCDVGGCIGLKTTKNPVKAARVALEKVFFSKNMLYFHSKLKFLYFF